MTSGDTEYSYAICWTKARSLWRIKVGRLHLTILNSTYPNFTFFQTLHLTKQLPPSRTKPLMPLFAYSSVLKPEPYQQVGETGLNRLHLPLDRFHLSRTLLPSPSTSLLRIARLSLQPSKRARIRLTPRTSRMGRWITDFYPPLRLS